MAQIKTQKYANVGYVGLAAILGTVLMQAVIMGADIARWSYPRDWPLTIPEIAGFALAIATYFVCRRNTQVNTFTNESVAELMKVTWPARKETIMSAGMISVFVSICALMLVTFDVVWGWAVKVLY